MNNYWFSADHHFGHENVLDYCNRPFATIRDHDDALISEWNEHVGRDDIVIYCGDFTLRSKKTAEQYAKQLNGNIIWIKGNHDSWIRKEKRYAYNKKVGLNHIIATHYPLRTWPRSFANGWNIHGHCHGNLRPVWYNQLDVGIDCIYFIYGSYRPVNYGEVGQLIDYGNETWIAHNKDRWNEIIKQGHLTREGELKGAV